MGDARMRECPCGYMYHSADAICTRCGRPEVVGPPGLGDSPFTPGPDWRARAVAAEAELAAERENHRVTSLAGRSCVEMLTGTESDLREAEAERDEFKRNYLGACELVAKMHAVAVGEVGGPRRGVVEDVADLRAEVEPLVALLRAVLPVVTGDVPYDEAKWDALAMDIRAALKAHEARQ